MVESKPGPRLFGVSTGSVILGSCTAFHRQVEQVVLSENKEESTFSPDKTTVLRVGITFRNVEIFHSVNRSISLSNNHIDRQNFLQLIWTFRSFEC